MNPATEYVAVLKLANHYAAVHVSGENKCFISQHPEVDLRIAQQAALTFAASRAILFRPSLLELDRPLITILKQEATWYPAAIYSNALRLLTNLGPVNLGSTQQEALTMGQIIAHNHGTDFIPSIGISLSQSTDKE